LLLPQNKLLRLYQKRLILQKYKSYIEANLTNSLFPCPTGSQTFQEMLSLSAPGRQTGGSAGKGRTELGYKFE